MSWTKTLARELIKLQKIPGKENSEAIDLLLPEDFDNILQVVEDITCYKDITGYRLYVFSLISYRLKNFVCVPLEKAGSMDFLIEQLQRFLELYETKWSYIRITLKHRTMKAS